MPASLFGTFFAVYHNDIGGKINVAVKQAAANRISVNRVRRLLQIRGCVPG